MHLIPVQGVMMTEGSSKNTGGGGGKKEKRL